ncbi:hypothetical protein IH982_01920 [Patescibacteria group bacterium]|nr:hypothetical protein [Patescibacteria group bacterium]
MEILSFLRLFLPHRNGRPQEAEQEAEEAEDEEPVELKAIDILPQRRDEGVQIIEDVEFLEEVVRAELGVEDVRISFKTGVDRKRILEVLVQPAEGFQKGKFSNLTHRISRNLAPRVGIPRPQVHVRKMRHLSRE